MIQNIETIFEKGLEQWRLSKGIGTAIIPNTVDDRYFVLMLLQKIYARHPTNNVLIVVETFIDRSNLIEFITHQEDEDNNKEFKQHLDSHRIKVFTKDYVEKNDIRTDINLVIVYHITTFNYRIVNLVNSVRFKLIVLNKLFDTTDENLSLYKWCPILDEFKTYELAEIRASLPVEEMWIGVDIADEAKRNLYDYYSKYIETSINIFGSFDILQKARIGDSALNISAAQICSQIAAENGWNEHLDMSSEYNRQIDELFNPNALSDRTSNTFEYIRNRTTIVSDYADKLPKILDIVKENEGKKILIISKRGEFATEITNYLNNMSEKDICGNYHDKVENIPAVDIYDNPMFYKTGAKKGERKSMGYQAQKTLNEAKFNLGLLNVLSTSAAPDKTLTINVDIIIITSPLCEDIKSYLYRLSNVSFIDNKIKLYSLFCKNTIEEKELRNKDCAENHVILNKCEYDNFIDNNFNFIIDN